VEWAGDKYAWDSVANNLTSANLTRTLPDEGETLSDKDRENWGVANPGLKLAATVRQASKEYSFTFGGHPPGSTGQVYATNSDKEGKVFVIPNSVVTSASKELRDLRNRKLLDVKFDDPQMSGIEVHTQGLSILAKKGADSTWQITEPTPARADSTMLRKFVDKLANDATDIRDNVSEDELRSLGLASDQLASATRYKVLTGSEGTSQSFFVGAFSMQDKGYVGRREGTNSLFVLAKEFFTDQPKTLEDLRPKKALSLETWNTDAISATAEENLAYSLEKKSGQWRMGIPHDATAERTVVEGLVRAFNDNKIRNFVAQPGTDEELGLVKPSFVFKAVAKDKTETVLFGKEEDGMVYAAWQGAPDRFRVEKKLLDALKKDPLDLLTAAERDRLKPKEQPAPASSEAAPAPAPDPEEPKPEEQPAGSGTAEQAAPSTETVPSATN
jgi:hypothetical protein